MNLEKLLILSVWLAIIIIAVYAGQKAIILAGRVSRDYLERISGWGGVLYLLGLLSAKNDHSHLPDLLSWVLLMWGVALLLIPKLYGSIVSPREMKKLE